MLNTLHIKINTAKRLSTQKPTHVSHTVAAVCSMYPGTKDLSMTSSLQDVY